MARPRTSSPEPSTVAGQMDQSPPYSRSELDDILGGLRTHISTATAASSMQLETKIMDGVATMVTELDAASQRRFSKIEADALDGQRRLQALEEANRHGRQRGDGDEATARGAASDVPDGSGSGSDQRRPPRSAAERPDSGGGSDATMEDAASGEPAGGGSGGSRKRPMPSAAERPDGEGAADGRNEEERPARGAAGSSDGAEGAGGRQARRRKSVGAGRRAERSTQPPPP